MNNNISPEFLEQVGHRLSEMEVVRVPETEEMVDRLVRFGGRVLVRHTDNGMVILFKSYEKKQKGQGKGRL